MSLLANTPLSHVVSKAVDSAKSYEDDMKEDSERKEENMGKGSQEALLERFLKRLAEEDVVRPEIFANSVIPNGLRPPSQQTLQSLWKALWVCTETECEKRTELTNTILTKIVEVTCLTDISVSKACLSSLENLELGETVFETLQHLKLPSYLTDALMSLSIRYYISWAVSMMEENVRLSSVTPTTPWSMPDDDIKLTLDTLRGNSSLYSKEVQQVIDKAWCNWEILDANNKLSATLQIAPHVDTKKFLTEKKYRDKVLTDLAQSRNPEMITAAVDLSIQLGIDPWTIRASHVGWLLTEVSIPTHEFFELYASQKDALMERPLKFDQVLEREIYPQLDGTEYEKLTLIYNLRESCLESVLEADYEDVIQRICSCVRVLQTIQKGNIRLNFKRLLDPQHVLEVIASVIDEQNLLLFTALSKDINSILQDCSAKANPPILNSSLIHRIFLNKVCRRENGIGSASEWLEDDNTQDCMRKLTPAHFSEFWYNFQDNVMVESIGDFEESLDAYLEGLNWALETIVKDEPAWSECHDMLRLAIEQISALGKISQFPLSALRLLMRIMPSTDEKLIQNLFVEFVLDTNIGLERVTKIIRILRQSRNRSKRSYIFRPKGKPSYFDLGLLVELALRTYLDDQGKFGSPKHASRSSLRRSCTMLPDIFATDTVVLEQILREISWESIAKNAVGIVVDYSLSEKSPDEQAKSVLMLLGKLECDTELKLIRRMLLPSAKVRQLRLELLEIRGHLSRTQSILGKDVHLPKVSITDLEFVETKRKYMQKLFVFCSDTKDLSIRLSFAETLAQILIIWDKSQKDLDQNLHVEGVFSKEWMQVINWTLEPEVSSDGEEYKYVNREDMNAREKNEDEDERTLILLGMLDYGGPSLSYQDFVSIYNRSQENFGILNASKIGLMAGMGNKVVDRMLAHFNKKEKSGNVKWLAMFVNSKTEFQDQTTGEWDEDLLDLIIEKKLAHRFFRTPIWDALKPRIDLSEGMEDFSPNAINDLIGISNSPSTASNVNKKVQELASTGLRGVTGLTGLLSRKPNG